MNRTAGDERLLASIENLRRQAIEAARIRDAAKDEAKRQMFDRLHQHFNRLADEVEQAMIELGPKTLAEMPRLSGRLLSGTGYQLLLV